MPPGFYTIMRKGYPEPVDNLAGTGQKRASKGLAQWTCRICTSWSNSSRSNALHHCRRIHEARLNKPQAHRPIDIFTDNTPSSTTLRRAFNRQDYKEVVVGLLTQQRVPFSAVEWNELKQLALACNPAIEDYLILSRRSAVRLIAANYKIYSKQLQVCFSKAVGLVHIQSDLWTSPHHHSLLAVCAQWVDQDYNLQKALLGLLECKNDHSGAAQANLILQILKKYDILNKIGWHTGDNATSNDTCLRAIETQLLEDHGIVFKAKQRRV